MRFVVAAAIAALAGAFALPAGAAQRQIVSGTRIAAIADRVAHDLVGGDRSIASAFPIADQDVPSGEVTIAKAGTPIVNAVYVSVPIEIDVDGRRERTVVAGYRVTEYVKTAVAAHDLAAGTLLGPGDITYGRSPANGRLAVAPEALLGRKVRAALARGASVYPEQTAANELVHAGDAVVLVIRDGAVALSADVVARTSGALGEHVAVYSTQTKKALSGIVIGSERVELVLPGDTE